MDARVDSVGRAFYTRRPTSAHFNIRDMAKLLPTLYRVSFLSCSLFLAEQKQAAYGSWVLTPSFLATRNGSLSPSSAYTLFAGEGAERPLGEPVLPSKSNSVPRREILRRSRPDRRNGLPSVPIPVSLTRVGTLGRFAFADFAFEVDACSSSAGGVNKSASVSACLRLVGTDLRGAVLVTGLAVGTARPSESSRASLSLSERDQLALATEHIVQLNLHRNSLDILQPLRFVVECIGRHVVSCADSNDHVECECI